MAVELVAGFAVLLVLILYLVQIALWWHAKATADTAAQQAVFAAKLPGASSAAGQEAAATILSATGHLGDVTITITSGPDTVVAEVRGTSPALAPFGARQVRSRAEAPIERFIPSGQRP